MNFCAFKVLLHGASVCVGGGWVGVVLLTERNSSGDEGCPESPSESWPLCGEMVLVWGVAGGLL